MFKRYLLIVERAESMNYLAEWHWSPEEWAAINQVELEVGILANEDHDLAD
jgi:hypothetical protein